MRLDMDCIRAILLFVEENTDLSRFVVFVNNVHAKEVAAALGEDPEQMPVKQADFLRKSGFDNHTLIYHLSYCIQAGLLESSDPPRAQTICVTDLTPKGHELLSRIRNDTIWGKIKEAVGKGGVHSAEALLQVGTIVLSEWVKSRLPLP